MICYLKIERKYPYQLDGSIGGDLYFNGRFLCYTLEKGWWWNENDVSCVPNGTYDAYVRFEGYYQEHWRIQLRGVESREGIQFHIGNTNTDSEGCILLGMSKRDGGVGDSKGAFRRLKEEIYRLIDKTSQRTDIEGIYGPIPRGLFDYSQQKSGYTIRDDVERHWYKRDLEKLKIRVEIEGTMMVPIVPPEGSLMMG